MRSLIFEGNTWAAYEQLREKDKRLHKALCKQLNEMLRADPAVGLGKPEHLYLCHWRSLRTKVLTLA